MESLSILKNKQTFDETNPFRKYQKCSFDDRQLPPVGIHYENDEEVLLNLKKEKIRSLVKNKKLSVPPPPPPRKNKRANYTERSTQILGAVNQRSTDTFRFEYVHQIPNQTEGDSLSADNEKSPRVVAVVTPIKKDKPYDTRSKYFAMNSPSPKGNNNDCMGTIIESGSSNTSSDSINNNKLLVGGNSDNCKCCVGIYVYLI